MSNIFLMDQDGYDNTLTINADTVINGTFTVDGYVIDPTLIRTLSGAYTVGSSVADQTLVLSPRGEGEPQNYGIRIDLGGWGGDPGSSGHRSTQSGKVLSVVNSDQNADWSYFGIDYDGSLWGPTGVNGGNSRFIFNSQGGHAFATNSNNISDWQSIFAISTFNDSNGGVASGGSVLAAAGPGQEHILYLYTSSGTSFPHVPHAYEWINYGGPLLFCPVGPGSPNGSMGGQLAIAIGNTKGSQFSTGNYNTVTVDSNGHFSDLQHWPYLDLGFGPNGVQANGGLYNTFTFSGGDNVGHPGFSHYLDMGNTPNAGTYNTFTFNGNDQGELGFVDYATTAELDGYLKNQSSVSEQHITTTSATDVINYTPAAQGNFLVVASFRVATATTNVSIKLTWTDQVGAQTQYIVPLGVSGSINEAVGTYTCPVTFINATASNIKITVTSGTANNLYVSAAVIAI